MDRLTAVFGTDRPVALVTGSGARRVGNAVVRALGARGYQCVVHAHHHIADAEATVRDLNATGSKHITLQADLSDMDQLRQLVDNVWSHFGRLDVLVNSAAIWEPKRLEEVTPEDVQRHFSINTLAVFELCRLVGLRMTQQSHGGAIINVGDWASERPYLDYAAYFPSKGAIPTLTRTFAIELAARNPRVRVNCILPGPVMLPPDLSSAERAASIAGTLVRREGSPEHVAAAAVFLAENDFINGVCLPVDGGRTIG